MSGEGNRCSFSRTFDWSTRGISVSYLMVLSTFNLTCRGQFVIEYVGELINYKEFRRRFDDYNAQGHKHFYFMSLTGDEVC